MGGIPGEEQFEAGVYARGGDFRGGQFAEELGEHAVENAAVGLVGVVPGLRRGVLRGIAGDEAEQVLQDLLVSVVLFDQCLYLFDVLRVGDP